MTMIVVCLLRDSPPQPKWLSCVWHFRNPFFSASRHVESLCRKYFFLFCAGLVMSWTQPLWNAMQEFEREVLKIQSCLRTVSITNENVFEFNVETKCPIEQNEINFFPPQNSYRSFQSLISGPDNLASESKSLPMPHINTHTQASRIIFHFFTLPIICHTPLLWAILNQLLSDSSIY